eukprot:6212927-Pleurochrysis_carterae.AAC.3
MAPPHKTFFTAFCGAAASTGMFVCWHGTNSTESLRYLVVRDTPYDSRALDRLYGEERFVHPRVRMSVQEGREQRLFIQRICTSTLSFLAKVLCRYARVFHQVQAFHVCTSPLRTSARRPHASTFLCSERCCTPSCARMCADYA